MPNPIHLGARWDATKAWLEARHAAGVAHATTRATESAARSAAAVAPAAAVKASASGAGGYFKGFVTGAEAPKPDFVEAAKKGLGDTLASARGHLLKNSAAYRDIGIGGGVLLAGAGIYRKRERQMSAREQLEEIIQFGPRMDRAWKKVINVAGHEDLRAINQIKSDLMSSNTSRRAIPEGIEKIQGLQRKVFLKRAALGAGTAVVGIPTAMAIANRKREFSAREQLNLITFGQPMTQTPESSVSPTYRAGLLSIISFKAGGNYKRHWSQKKTDKDDKKRVDPKKKKKHFDGMNDMSAREQLDSIINFGPDPRPRNPLGEFSGSDDGTPSPSAMKIAYGPAVAGGAAAGVAGAGATMGLKALLEKLRKK